MTEQQQDAAAEAATYDVVAAQDRWRKVWDDLNPFQAADETTRERRYALTMFPYPSGDLHMGHAEVMALHDVIARYWWQRGYEVLNPMGWDSFGLPAENAAIRNDAHPADYTYGNIATQYESFRKYGVSFDWSRRFNTSDPSYYRWTQWLFLKFHERGLAYRKNSPVNWCPNDQTVLANEQVVDGSCERCGAEVTKRELTQWYFRTTAYAQELLDRLDDLQPTWSDKVVNAQRNWIGRSEGAHVDFVVDGREDPLTVYTTRPDTLFGATFMVVAADAALAAELVTEEHRGALDDYLVEVRRETEINRLATDRPKTGVFLGVHATNPLTGARIPVYAADYVLADYGTGAIMAVPGQDQRDWDFATAFDLPIVRTVQPPADWEGEAFTGEGPAINSANDEIDLSGMGVDEAKSVTIAYLEQKGLGRGTVNFRLRDWLLSRQRYWGAPIPIIHCPVDGEVPVPEDQLPVELPELRGADLKPKGTSPLGAATDWVDVTCPTCGGPAKRDTDTMDTFVDSSWYFFRYVSPHDDGQAFDKRLANLWGPVDLYIGGDEHAVLHLLYARFFTKALRDMGLVDWDEPFSAYLSQGKVINNGRKMSKSLGNGVNLGEQLAEFGVDAVRLTLVFAGPPEDNIDWADMSPGGSLKFLQRAWRLSGDVTSAPGTPPGRRRRRAAQGHAPDRARRRGADRQPPVQRDGRPDHGAGERHPQGDRHRLRPGRPRRARGRRDRRDHAVAGGALHGRGDVVATGPRADRRAGRLADRRRGAAGRGLRHRDRAGAGQAAREAGGVARHLRGRPGGGRDGRRGGAAVPGRQRSPQGDRARPQAGQHRRELTQDVIRMAGHCPPSV